MDEIKSELLTAETTSTLLVVRPGDILFVMPIAGEYWSDHSRERLAATLKEQIPEARVIVLTASATFATVAMEARDP